MTLTLGFSPCPNDCFMFDAIVNQRIDLEGLSFDVVIDDVEALNRRTFDRALDVTKLSFHAFAHVTADYALLDAGAALGRGCGPLLISKRPLASPDFDVANSLRIAIPGVYTTANLLLSLAFPPVTESQRIPMIFSDIESAVLDGRCDAGVIIHEKRFTYEARGLRKVIDLGEFWEQTSGAAIPLGGIVVRRSLDRETQLAMNRVMRRSVEYAFANPTASAAFVRAHAQEMSEHVQRQHIDLYVNSFSVDLGPEGRYAVEALFDRAAQAGALRRSETPLFL